MMVRTDVRRVCVGNEVGSGEEQPNLVTLYRCENQRCGHDLRTLVHQGGPTLNQLQEQLDTTLGACCKLATRRSCRQVTTSHSAGPDKR